jgi:hypothetical protein
VVKLIKEVIPSVAVHTMAMFKMMLEIVANIVGQYINEVAFGVTKTKVIKDFVVIVVVDKEYFLLPFDES